MGLQLALLASSSATPPVLLVEAPPGVDEPLPGCAAAGQESRGTDVGSGEQLLGPSGGSSEFGISSMALSASQDSVFMIISQQLGNLAPR